MTGNGDKACKFLMLLSDVALARTGFVFSPLQYPPQEQLEIVTDFDKDDEIEDVRLLSAVVTLAEMMTMMMVIILMVVYDDRICLTNQNRFPQLATLTASKLIEKT